MENKDIKPKVGDKVWRRPSRYDREKEVIEGIISKVGRKYITVKFHGFNESQFDIEKLLEKSNYGAPARLYLLAQDIIDENEKTNLLSRANQQFGGYGQKKNLSLDQMRRIVAIIDEEVKP